VDRPEVETIFLMPRQALTKLRVGLGILRGNRVQALKKKLTWQENVE
jgi:hypothetical protein